MNISSLQFSSFVLLELSSDKILDLLQTDIANMRNSVEIP